MLALELVKIRYAEALVLSEQSADKIARDVDLIQRCQQDTQREHGACGPDIAPDIFQKALEQVRIGGPAFAFMKAGEVEERLALFAVEQADQPPGHAAAEGAAYAADHHRRPPQCTAVEDQLRVEQYAGHHECRQIIVLHALL